MSEKRLRAAGNFSRGAAKHVRQSTSSIRVGQFSALRHRRHSGKGHREQLRRLFAMDSGGNHSEFFDYDQLVSLPGVPHEVVGFTAPQYLFPGVRGPQILNFFHGWRRGDEPDDYREQVDACPRVVDTRGRMVTVPKLAQRWCAPDKRSRTIRANRAAWDAESELSKQGHIVSRTARFTPWFPSDEDVRTSGGGKACTKGPVGPTAVR